MEKDLEEQIVLEQSIESARHEEKVVHRVVEDSFETLSEDRLCAWLRAKKKGKKAGHAARVPQFLTDPLIPMPTEKATFLPHDIDKLVIILNCSAPPFLAEE
jgi:hypothetical protein